MNSNQKSPASPNPKRTVSISDRGRMLMIMILPLLAGIFGASAQNVVRESVEELHKGENHPAFSITLTCPAAVAEEALAMRMKSDGVSGKKSKGVTEYKQVSHSHISPTKVDIYTKVVGDKLGSSSTVYFFVSKGYENFVTGSNDAALAGNIKKYMTGIQPDVYRHHLNLRVAEQDKVVKKNQKDYDKLVQQQQKLNMEVEAALQSLNNNKSMLDNLMLEQVDSKK